MALSAFLRIQPDMTSSIGFTIRVSAFRSLPVPVVGVWTPAVPRLTEESSWNVRGTVQRVLEPARKW
jgi:hypothetical protein